MKGKPSISINGRLYDALTGMPITQAAPKQAAPTGKSRAPAVKPTGTIQRAMSDIATPAKQTAFKKTIAKATAPKKPSSHNISQTIHRKPQKSQTLYRAAVKRPTVVNQVQSPAISKFATTQPTPVEQKPKAQAIAEPAPTVHPAVAKALHGMHQRQTPQKPEQPQSSKQLKEALIKERLAEAQQKQQTNKKAKGNLRRRPRLATILTSSLAVLLLGGYLTYINLPNISMRVAATRSGVAATFPGYHPDGFSFNGPITYSPGEVSINFKSNTNDTTFTVKQTKSSWDSQAVLDNYITKQSQNYMTQQEQGLTIYSFGNRAAWVNGGLLYTVEGNAQLSSEQVLRLATSM